VVAKATEDNQPLHVVGSGWSFEDCASSDGVMVEQLDAGRLALPTLGGSNGQALAGVISTSTHGGDWNQPPFPDIVRAVHLVFASDSPKLIH
jgi:hypothetical protein